MTGKTTKCPQCEQLGYELSSATVLNGSTGKETTVKLYVYICVNAHRFQEYIDHAEDEIGLKLETHTY
jgi:hypothetical protein